MKKHLLFILTLLLASSAIAQPTLTFENTAPKIGDQLSSIFLVENFDLAHNGANQTWDFSAFTGMNFQSNYISLENSTESILFSDANIVLSGNGIEESAELYYASSNDEMSIVGLKTNGIPSIMLTYTDLELHLKFPISYDDTCSDSFSAEAENHLGQNYVRSGNIEIKADGYGTLILPETTISNALRIRTIKNYNDVESGEIAFEYIDTIYNWYDGIHNFPLATASNIQSFIPDFEGPAVLSLSTISFIDQLETTTALNSIEKQNQFSFYPNPATDFIYTNKATRIEIYDLRGALVKSENITNQRIDISDLKSGMYIVKSPETNYSEKLIVNQ
ncbi:MAG: T9SS type A sorting domain-containing protein [Flavobacteriales bacterium]